jgi:hypothetical protein
VASASRSGPERFVARGSVRRAEIDGFEIALAELTPNATTAIAVGRTTDN